MEMSEGKIGVRDLEKAGVNECVDYMFSRCPTIDSISIPREVMDRADLTPSAKLLYGLVSRFKNGMSMRKGEIAGLLGMSPWGVGSSRDALVKAGLITYKRRWITPTHQMPAVYRAVPPQKRFEGYTHQPKFTKNKIYKIEDDINDYFDEIKLK